MTTYGPASWGNLPLLSKPASSPPAPIPVQAPATEPAPTTRTKPSEAKRSIHFLLDAAMTYGHVGGLVDLLDSIAALHQYKPYNAMLVLLQRPGATCVLPAHVWGEKYGRLIKPDEQPLVMLQPRGPVMFLFDVSQTEPGPDPKPLPPHLTNPYAMRDYRAAAQALSWVIENAKGDGVRVHPVGHGLPRAGCISTTAYGPSQQVLVRRQPETHRDVRVRYEVLLNRAYSDTEQLATLAHELGHLYCGHLGLHDAELWPEEPLWPDRHAVSKDQAELEAESVAYLVFKRLDPGNPLPDHLSQYFDQVPPLASGDVERVLTAAGRVLEMSEGFAPRRSKRIGKKPGNT